MIHRTVAVEARLIKVERDNWGTARDGRVYFEEKS